MDSEAVCLLLYGEWVEENVLEPVAHRQYVFTVRQLLRPIFARHRQWLGELCRIAARLLLGAYARALPGTRPRKPPNDRRMRSSP